MNLARCAGLLLGIAAGCRSTETLLLPEAQIPSLDALGRTTDRLFRQTVKVRSDANREAPIELAFHEYGDVKNDRVVLAIHGVISDHRTWRYLIGALDGDPAVWAVDLPGCGESDKPQPAVTRNPDAYSPTWMAKHVMSALRRQLQGQPDSLRITVLAHSLGGGVTLRMLGDPDIAREYADVLAHIDGAVLFSCLEFGITPFPQAFQTLAHVSDFQFTAGNIAGFVKSAAVAAVYGSSVDPDRIPREEFDRLYSILTQSDTRYPMQAMLQRAVPHTPDGARDRPAIRRLVAEYENVRVPCLLLWGELDDTLPSALGYVLAKHIPDSRQRLVTLGKHSVHVEQPELCASQVREFLATDLASWPSEVPLLGRVTPTGGERVVATTKQDESLSRLQSAPLATSPSSVSVLPGRNVTRSGARYLSDALRMAPGVEVQRISSTESGVAFRGYADASTAAQGTLGLVDDRQVYNPFLGNVLWDQLAVRLEDIKSIELVRGPGSFVHGPNAMHGVVNVLTRSPLDYEEDLVSVISHVGSYDSFVTGATLVNRSNFAGVKLSAQWDDIGQFDNDRGDTRNKGFLDGAFETQLDGDPDHVLGFAGGFSQQQFDLLLPMFEGIPATTADNESRDLYAKATYRKGDPDAVAFRSQLSWSGSNVDFLPRDLYQPFTLDVDTVDFDGRLTWAGTAHRLTSGAGFRFSGFDTRDADVSDGAHSVNEFWLFGQDEFRLTERLSLTFGARLDHHSVTGTSVSPRLATVWECFENHYLRASAGRGFRNPSLRELWFDMPVQGVPGLPTATIAGNTRLDPESLTSFEFGYFGAWGSLIDAPPGTVVEVGRGGKSHQFEVGASIFYNRVDDLVGFQADPTDPLRFLPVNQDDEEVYGFELEGRYFLHESFSAFANYSYSERRNRDTGARSRVTPRNTVNAGMAYTRSDLSVMLWVNYRDATELDDIAIDRYVLLNGSVNYDFPVAKGSTGRAFVRFFNVLNDEHREHPQGDVYGAIVTGGVQIRW